jgi:hypothetical protein
VRRWDIVIVTVAGGDYASKPRPATSSRGSRSAQRFDIV